MDMLPVDSSTLDLRGRVAAVRRSKLNIPWTRKCAFSNNALKFERKVWKRVNDGSFSFMAELTASE